MKNQMDLFTGKDLRDQGIKKAEDNANDKNENWSAKAYGFLLVYCGIFKQFLAEEVRNASIEAGIPEPPSKRAWGAIVLRAKKNGKIRSIGFRSVKNPKAHCTPATLWEVVK